MHAESCFFAIPHDWASIEEFTGDDWSNRFPRQFYGHLSRHVTCRADDETFVTNVYVEFPAEIILKVSERPATADISVVTSAINRTREIRA